MNVNEQKTNASRQSPLPERGDRLDSWKEIAVYLDREVRTVQRWEKREGLPVHRHFHVKARTVYAFNREIDVWLTGRGQAQSEPRPPQKHSKQAARCSSELARELGQLADHSYESIWVEMSGHRDTDASDCREDAMKLVPFDVLEKLSGVEISSVQQAAS